MNLETSQPSPRILSRDQHAISRRDISTAALRVLYALKDAGHAAYLVGGAVRDLLLGGHPKDFDVATDATPEQLRGLFRSCRLVGRRFVIAHVRFAGEIIEVTTFRGHGGEVGGGRHVADDGRLARDNVFGSIEEDAQRRDFTVNALYYNIVDFTVVDFVGSLADLEARRLRLIGDPLERFREDPVRMLRAARLAAKLGFSLDPATEAPIAQARDLLAGIPPARLFDEFGKLFLTGHGRASLAELRRLKLFDALFPALDDDQAIDFPLLEVVLADSDRRHAEQRPVSPAFLMAALAHAEATRKAAGIKPGPEASRRIEQALSSLSGRVGLPRRFQVAALEMLDLERRMLAVTQPSRARRLAGHPRLKAAYDLLQLRAPLDPLAAAAAPIWRAIVEEGRDPAELPMPQAADAAEAPDRKRRRRRRRGPRGEVGAEFAPPG